VPLVPVVWNEDEDFGRDLVDWGEPVLQGPNEAEDFESVPLENINLKHDASKPLSTRQFCLFVHLSPVEGCRDPVKSHFSPPT